MPAPLSLSPRTPAPHRQNPAHLQPAKVPEKKAPSAGHTRDGFDTSSASTRRTSGGDQFEGGGSTVAAKTKTPYYSQFEGGHGYKPSKVACYSAASAMARAGGARPAANDAPSKRPSQETLAKSKANDWMATSQQGDTITVDPKRAAKGRAYLDGQLDAGKPVVVGVNRPRGKNLNSDGITDHWVTVTGRGTDEKGRTYYSFHDPALGAAKGKDSNPRNRFYVDQTTGKLYRPEGEGRGLGGMRYEASAVRHNVDRKNVN